MQVVSGDQGGSVVVVVLILDTSSNNARRYAADATSPQRKIAVEIYYMVQ